MSPPSFKLPRDGSSYTEAIFERSRQLIKTGIWKEVDPLNLRAWLSNFETPEEQYFAACILDSLMYRSQPQTAALITELFDRVIPGLNSANNARNPLKTDWLNYLKQPPQRSSSPLIIVPVIRDGDPPTKSGPLLCRLLSKQLRIKDYHFVWPWQIDKFCTQKKSEAILFIDDFLGTGHQFEEFISGFNINHILKSKYCIYAPLVAHEKGLSYLKKAFPSLLLSCSELLTARTDIFSSQCSTFDDGENTIESAHAFYKKLVLKSKFPHTSARRGYGKLGIVYSFSHATPDNSIPLIWWKSGSWNPLFLR